MGSGMTSTLLANTHRLNVADYTPIARLPAPMSPKSATLLDFKGMKFP